MGINAIFVNFNGNSFDIGWNTLWKVRTMRRQDGYTVEMAIPFKTLRYDPPKGGEPIEWGVSLVRYARRDIEVSTFPAIPQSFTPYRMTYAAKLKELRFLNHQEIFVFNPTVCIKMNVFFRIYKRLLATQENLVVT